MNQTAASHASPADAPRMRFRGPIWTLLLLAPFIAEVLSGATRTSVLFVYIPEVMVWGVGALLARELVRRWRAGGVSLLCLGLALSVAEEFIVQQTSLAPIPFAGSHPDYARVWGINLVYFLFMLGFESVWVVVVPVQITELFFPQRREFPWLRRPGLIVSCFVFLIGCRMAWYAWIKRARPMLHAVPYQIPTRYLVAGFLAIAALIALAYALRNVARARPADTRGTAPAWLAFVVAFIMGAAWFELIAQNFVPKPIEPFWIAFYGGLAWAVAAVILFVWWSSRPAWSAVHRFAAAFGATLACQAVPYANFATWPPVDRVGKIIFDLLALVGFFLLGRRVIARSRAHTREMA
jgi:hypothetical protein